MRYPKLGLVACLVSPMLVSACSDDGGGVTVASLSGVTEASATVASAAEAQTTSGHPTSESSPTTSAGGSNSQGTDSATTTTEPGTTSTDPSASSTGGSTSNATTADMGDTGDTGSSSTGEPPPMCTDADCVMGQFCNMNSGLCEPGCNEDMDCMSQTVGDVDANVCTGCLVDANCGLGTVCDKGTKTCVPGCNDMQPCQDGLACCAGQCFDLLTDVNHCGGCAACPVPDNAAASCTMGVCGLGACMGDFNNCDKDPGNGCEVDGTCECVPGEKIGCYTGPEGTPRTRASARAACRPATHRARRTAPVRARCCRGRSISAPTTSTRLRRGEGRGPGSTATAGPCVVATVATRSGRTAKIRTWSTRAPSSSRATWSTTTVTA